MRFGRMLLACALALSGAGDARAQDGPVRVVDLTMAAAAEDAESLEQVIAELLGGLHVETRPRRVETVDPREVVDPPADPPPALARVWMAIDRPHATLYLADAPRERVLVRRVPLGAGLDEAGREQLAQIVLTAVDALLSGARIGLERAAAREELVARPQPEPEPPPEPAPPSPPPTPAPERPGTTVEAWVGGALPFWADGPKVGGAPFARAAVIAGGGRWRPVIALEVSVRPEQRERTDLVDLGLRAFDARREAGVDSMVDDSLGLRALAGLTLDVTSVDPRPTADGGVTTVGVRDDAIPLVSARLEVRRRLGRWSWILGGIGVEADLVDTCYVVRNGAREITVLDPWSVRPFPLLAMGGRW